MTANSLSDFMFRFLISSLFISIVAGMILAARYLGRKWLTARTQYHLWFPFLLLLAVPFFPKNLSFFLPYRLSFWLQDLKNRSLPFFDGNTFSNTVQSPDISYDWIQDFSLTLSGETFLFPGLVLFCLWIAGILFMSGRLVRGSIRLRALKNSALPLQSKKVRLLYDTCIKELHIKKRIPVYSTAFLSTPIFTGIFHPCIYLPIHLISNYNDEEMRYILLHELQHFKHRDTFAGCFMNLFAILYWFHPAVRYSLKEMQNDREIACDTSVLNLLRETDYKAYGHTLLNFAKKISLYPFPFFTGISGNMRQMKRRILNIADYKKPSFLKKITSAGIWGMITALLFCFIPVLASGTIDTSAYSRSPAPEKMLKTDLSAYFGSYEGSFVLYDADKDIWQIYNPEDAARRSEPLSTYKIYDALFGLEEGIITSEDSRMVWDKTVYSYSSWNADQNLFSAMNSSVNWYFEAIDQKLTVAVTASYLRKIGYGNQHPGKNTSCWLGNSLKISPVEQVTLLTEFYNNTFGFAPENVSAVKKAIGLSSSPEGILCGKTGTESKNGNNVSGWFIGYVEKGSRTYFFATRIQADTNASGSTASKIALSILSDENIWQ